MRHLAGGSSKRPTKQQYKVLTDILVSMGWNTGRRRPTRSMDPNAWWLAEEDRAARQARELVEAYADDNELRMFVTAARSVHPKGYIPCKIWPNNPKHRYQLAGNNPLRLQCGNKDCKHSMSRQAMTQYLVDMMDRGIIPQDIEAARPQPTRIQPRRRRRRRQLAVVMGSDTGGRRHSHQSGRPHHPINHFKNEIPL